MASHWAVEAVSTPSVCTCPETPFAVVVSTIKPTTSDVPIASACAKSILPADTEYTGAPVTTAPALSFWRVTRSVSTPSSESPDWSC